MTSSATRPLRLRPRLRAARGALVRTAALAAVPLLLAACEGADLEKYPQTTFAPASDYAEHADWLFMYVLAFGVGVMVLVFGLLAYIMVRYRYRPGAPEPEQVLGNTRLEIAWTLIPAAIVAAIAVPTVDKIFATQAPAPADALTVEVIGKQWWWEFRYPLPNGDTVVTANEIHVPVGRTVDLKMTSDNVLHSFWVPQMGGKRDLVPNRTNHIVFRPEEPGVYLGQCAEFCGDSHALMRMRLVAHTPENFAAWLENEARPAAVLPADEANPPLTAADSAVEIGRRLVTTGACAGCHLIEGEQSMVGRLGPALTHFGRRRTMAAGILDNNAENLATWLENPPAVKPGSLMPDLELTDEQIRYIVAYLQSLQ